VRIDTRHIALFKFLLEAHGHLGFMSVADKHAAILKISYSPDQEREIQAFLEEVRDTVPFSVIDLDAVSHSVHEIREAVERSEGSSTWQENPESVEPFSADGGLPGGLR
jgi:hypothetical protein